MKTLSVKQPYATLMCAGIKPVENRTWTTDYRGRLLIHASSTGEDLFSRNLPLPIFQEYNRVVSMDGELIRQSDLLDIVDYTLRLKDNAHKQEFRLLKAEILAQADYESTLFSEHAIIGHVDLLDIVKNHDSVWSEPDQWHWIFGEPVLYANQTKPVQGHLRVWNYDGMIDSTPVQYPA